MNHYLAAVSALGDPRDQSTWSRTPKRITDALESLGCDILSINAQQSSRFKRRIFTLSNILNGLSTDDVYRAGLARRYTASEVYKTLKEKNCKTVLSFDSYHLPLPRKESSISQYLYADLTWHLFCENYPASDVARHNKKQADLAERLEKQSYMQMQHIFCTAQYVKDDLVAHYDVEPQRVTVTGSGLGRIKPFHGQKDYVHGHILFVARHSFSRKGGYLLLDGFKLAQKLQPNLKLVIVGNEADQDSIRAINSIPNIDFYGDDVDGQTLQSLFNSASLLAMPAIGEPWGLVYLEALACRTPVLGLRRNALPEITNYGEFGFLINDPEPEDIADALLQAIANPETLKHMGEKGQEYCLSRYSWDLIAKTIFSTMFNEY